MAQNKQYTVVMTLTVTFDTNGTPTDTLFQNIQSIAYQAAGAGLMTGDTEAEVDRWEVKMEERK